MEIKANLDFHIGSFVNIFNEKMSLFGMLRKTTIEGRYRVDVLRGEGYYIFTVEDVIKISTENSTIIALK